MLQEKSGQKEAILNEMNKSNRDNFLILLDIITFMTLSLVVFGIFCIGFFVAPIVFKNLTPRPLASEIMTDIFLRYYPFAFACSVVALLNESLRFALSFKITKSKKIMITRLVCIFSVCLMTAYSDKKLLPEINQMRLEQKGPTLWTNYDFISLHKQSEKLGKLSFAIGLIPLILMISTKKRA